MTITEALDLLASQGDEDDIAAYLAAEGVKGEPCHRGGCALAVWLVQVDACGIPLVEPYKLAFSSNTPGIVLGDVPGDVVQLPLAVNDFALLFDLGYYPELIAGATA